MPKRKGLTDNERRALERYMIHGNMARAYREAYPNANKMTAERESKRLFKRPHVARELELEREAERQEHKNKFGEIVRKLEEVYEIGIDLKTDALGNHVPNSLNSAVAALSEINRMLGHHDTVKVENTIKGEIRGFNEFYDE